MTTDKIQRICGNRRAFATSILDGIEKDCQVPGWGGDSEPEDPVESSTVALARKFLECVPEGTPISEVTMSSGGGEIEFTWYAGDPVSRANVVVYLGPECRFYSDDIDGGCSQGAVVFDGICFPSDLLTRIQAVTPSNAWEMLADLGWEEPAKSSDL